MAPGESAGSGCLLAPGGAPWRSLTPGSKSFRETSRSPNYIEYLYTTNTYRILGYIHVCIHSSVTSFLCLHSVYTCSIHHMHTRTSKLHTPEEWTGKVRACTCGAGFDLRIQRVRKSPRLRRWGLCRAWGSRTGVTGGSGLVVNLLQKLLEDVLHVICPELLGDLGPRGPHQQELWLKLLNFDYVKGTAGLHIRSRSHDVRFHRGVWRPLT